MKKLKAKITIKAPINIIEEIISFLKKKYTNNEVNFYVEEELSSREIEVLKFVSEGKSNNEIGKIMNISHNTVKVYISKICQKLAVKDRLQATVKAIKRNLI